MAFFVLILLLGFAGGFAIGAAVFGVWRRRLILIWAVLPLAAYQMVHAGLVVTGLRDASIDWGQAVPWFWVGLLGFVGLPMLLFAGAGVLGYLVAPAPKREWRLKGWRLPQ